MQSDGNADLEMELIGNEAGDSEVSHQSKYVELRCLIAILFPDTSMLSDNRGLVHDSMMIIRD